MGDAPPVIVPTAVFEPFDFGDEPFGDHDAIASVLDDPGRMLGVERDATQVGGLQGEHGRVVRDEHRPASLRRKESRGDTVFPLVLRRSRQALDAHVAPGSKRGLKPCVYRTRSSSPQRAGMPDTRARL